MQSTNLPKKVGHYTLFRFLDSGGMGEVFLAIDEILQRPVAIKFLHLHHRESDRRARFMNEARAIAALNHPNIVVIHEINETPDEQNENLPVPYIVMEYIEGESLENILNTHKLTTFEVIILALQIAEGLQAAHQRKIVHRDIKPSNIMITKEGRVKILDFGLSKLVYETSSEASTQIKRTAEGTIVGTIPYLSPEQALGQNVDARSDIFSYGIVLYRMLTNQHPFPGSNAIETTTKIVTQEPEPWPYQLNIDSGLKNIVVNCLQKIADDRYSSLEEVIKDLEAVLRKSPFETSAIKSIKSSPLRLTTVPPSVASEPYAETQLSQAPIITGEVVDFSKQIPTKKGRKTTVVTISLLLFALISVTGFLIARSRTSRPEEVKTTQLTNSLGMDIYPTFSFDGKSIAYSSDRSGDFELYMKQLTPGGREIKLTSDKQQNFQPAWSPNGQYIAYHSKNRGGIWLIPSLGGVARQLTEFGSRPAWSPNGETIAFQSDPLVDLGANASPAMPPSTIWLVSATGNSEAVQLTRTGEPTGGHGTPNWSPDGTRIVFASYDRRNSSIWSVSTKGDKLVRVVYRQRYIYDPVYSPDGEAIYYCALSESGNYGMWKIAIDKETGEPKTEPEQIANLGLGTVRHLAISQDGKKVSYSGLSTISNLFSVAVSARTYEAASDPTALTGETGRNSRPVFSPDGEKIAFEKWQAGNNQDIWTMRADGNEPTQLTTDPAVDSSPNWFPESDRLSYRTNRSGNAEVWSTLLGSGKESLLIDVGRNMDYFRLSPDGKTLAFNSKKGGETINIWTAELSSGEQKQITFDKEMIAFPCWSANGNHIAAQMKRGEDSHIVVFESNGDKLEQLTKGSGQNWCYSWAPDNDKIAFAGIREGFWNIWWISRSTKEEKRITNYKKLNAYVRYPAWSPKGNQIVYEYAETTGNIWMIENVK
ncbi:MAG: serine/threonine-protein kinase [Blastocatellia bacterium]|nr:serine/threonine-protein kinase [Blastocatellia bacterium]